MLKVSRQSATSRMDPRGPLGRAEQQRVKAAETIGNEQPIRKKRKKPPELLHKQRDAEKNAIYNYAVDGMGSYQQQNGSSVTTLTNSRNLQLHVTGTPHLEDVSYVATLSGAEPVIEGEEKIFVQSSPKKKRVSAVKSRKGKRRNIRIELNQTQPKINQRSVHASLRTSPDESPAFMLAPKEDWGTPSQLGDSLRTPSWNSTVSSLSPNRMSWDTDSQVMRLALTDGPLTPKPSLGAPQSSSPNSAHDDDNQQSLVKRRKRKHPNLTVSKDTYYFDDSRPKTSLGVPGRRTHSVRKKIRSKSESQELLHLDTAVTPVHFEEKSRNYATVLNYKSNPSEMTFEEISAVMERRLKRKTGYHSTEFDDRRLNICREALSVFIGKYPRFAYFLGTIKKEFDVHIAHYEHLASEHEKMVNVLKREKDFLEEGHREMFQTMDAKYKKIIADIQDKLRVFTEKLENYTVQNLSLKRQNELLLQQLNRQRNKNSILIDLIRRTQDESTVNICVGLMERLEGSLQPDELDSLKKNIFETNLVDLKQMSLIKPQQRQYPHTINHSFSSNTGNQQEEAASPNKYKKQTPGAFDFPTCEDRAVEALLVPGLSSSYYDWENIVEESCLPPEIVDQLSHQNFEHSLRDIVAEYDHLFFELEKLKRRRGIELRTPTAHSPDTDDDFPEEHIRMQSRQSSLIFTPKVPSRSLEKQFTDPILQGTLSNITPSNPLDETFYNIIDPPRKFIMGNRVHSMKQFRYSGKLQFHNFSFEEALKIMSDFWVTKLSIDRQIPADARTHPADFLMLYFRKMCAESQKSKIPQKLFQKHQQNVNADQGDSIEKQVLGYVYSIQHICEKYRLSDVDFALFYRVIFDGTLHQDLVMAMDSYCGRLRVLVEQFLATHSGKMRRAEFQEILQDFFPTKSNEDMAKLNHALRRMSSNDDQIDSFSFNHLKIFESFPDSPNCFLREIRRQYYYERETYLAEVEDALVAIAESCKDTWDPIEGDYILTLEDYCNAIQKVDPAKPLRSLDFVLSSGFACDLEELQPDLELQRRIYKANKKILLREFMCRIHRINIRGSFR